MGRYKEKDHLLTYVARVQLEDWGMTKADAYRAFALNNSELSRDMFYAALRGDEVRKADIRTILDWFDDYSREFSLPLREALGQQLDDVTPLPPEQLIFLPWHLTPILAVTGGDAAQFVTLVETQLADFHLRKRELECALDGDILTTHTYNKVVRLLVEFAKSRAIDLSENPIRYWNERAHEYTDEVLAPKEIV